MTNGERGAAIRMHLAEAGRMGTCWICGDLFEEAPVWAERALRKVRDIEFATYLFGVQLSPRLQEMDSLFTDRFPSPDGEPLKHAFNRTVGKAFEAGLPHPATVEFASPDVSFVIGIASESLRLHIASLYVYGRYRKLARGIPQTRWPCRRCRGRGCALLCLT